MRFQTKHSLATFFKVSAVIPIVMMMCNFAGEAVGMQCPPPCSMAPYYGSTTSRNISDNGYGDITGQGTTQPLSNPYGHQGQVIVTVSSLANGRSVSYDTGFITSFAQGQVVLPFDETDPGPFQACTDHHNFCPIAGIQFAGSSGCTDPFTPKPIPLRWLQAKVTDTIYGSIGGLAAVTLNLTSDQCNGSQFVCTVTFTPAIPGLDL